MEEPWGGIIDEKQGWYEGRERASGESKKRVLYSRGG